MALSAEQLARLAAMVGEAHKDVEDRLLSDADLQSIADDVARVPDDNGNAPNDDNYIDTYDLYRAAAEGWRRKAGIFSEEFDFESEGAVFNRSQKYRQALQQAARYAGMAQAMTTNTGTLD